MSDKYSINVSEAIEGGYATLGPSHTAFRLIRVLPTRHHSHAIQVEMWHDNLTSRSYKCLSYRWGERETSRTILVNGHRFWVRDNLYDFLEYASTAYTFQPLWIDAICINQNDGQERARQVARMSSIYSRAEDVVIWLDGDANMQKFFTWVLEGDYYTFYHDPERVSIHTDFIKHPYWTRAWITQEILLARHVTLVHRTGRLDLDFLWVLWNEAIIGKDLPRSSRPRPQLMNVDSPPYVFAIERLNHIETMQMRERITDKEIRVDLSRYDFWALLSWRADAECRLAVDRIYGLCGLANGSRGFQISYTESPSELFWRAGHFFIAWGNVAFMDALRTCLRLGAATSLRPPEGRESICMPLRACYFSKGHHEQYSYSRLLDSSMKRVYCDDCGVEFESRSQDSILMCAAWDRKRPSYTGSTFAHVLLARDSRISDTYSLSLFPGDVHPVLRMSTIPLPAASLLHRWSNKDWTPMLRWSDVKEALGARRASDVYADWEIQLPASYVLSFLKAWDAAFRTTRC